jgi:hypothetical protein
MVPPEMGTAWCRPKVTEHPALGKAWAMGHHRRYQKVRVLLGLAFYRHHRVLGLGLLRRGREQDLELPHRGRAQAMGQQEPDLVLHRRVLEQVMGH